MSREALQVWTGVTEVLAGGRIPKHRIVNEEDRMGGIPMSLV